MITPFSSSLYGAQGRTLTILSEKKGFTLLEVMISLAIFSSVVVVVVGSLNYHLGLLAYDTDLVNGTIIGREKVEEHAITGLPKVREGQGENGHERFKWSVETSGTEVKGLVRIETGVEWGDSPGITFVTFSAE